MFKGTDEGGLFAKESDDDESSGENMFMNMLKKRPAAAALGDKADKKRKLAIGDTEPTCDESDDTEEEKAAEAKAKVKTPQQQALTWAKKCDEKKAALMGRQAALKGIEEAGSLLSGIKETIGKLTAAHKDLQRFGTTTEPCKKSTGTKCKAADQLCTKAALQLTQNRGFTKCERSAFSHAYLVN